MEWDIYNDNHEPLSDELIEGFEKITQFKLPEDYKQCVKFNHGGQPQKDCLEITVGDKPWDIGFGTLMTLDPLSNHTNVIKALATFRRIENAPKHILPIVIGGGGDYLCFDYSESTTVPKIVFYFHELMPDEGIYEVANSFAELLSMLTEDE